MAKVHFQTYGCSNNVAESEIMQGLVKKKHALTSLSESDVVVLNLCTVKGDEAALEHVKKVKREHPGKKIVAAGCVTKQLIPRIKKVDPEASILSTHHIDKITEVVDEPQELIQLRTDLVKLEMPRVRSQQQTAIIPISNSCYGTCTFCSVKRVKGAYYSFPEEKIVAEVKQAVESGCKEVWLTSQDNGCYGMDNGSSLAQLITRVAAVPGDFHIRVGMLNPDYLEKDLAALTKAFALPKVYTFLHLCIQAGSDAVLKDMSRAYDVATFKKIVAAFRKAIPLITLATDIIVGYPTETEAHFQETLDLVEDIRFDVINTARFRRRPGTPAARLTPLSKEVVKERSKRLNEVFYKTAQALNERWIGWEGEVLVVEEGKENTMHARNEYYKQVVLPSHHAIGEKVKVKIKKVTKWDLRV